MKAQKSQKGQKFRREDFMLVSWFIQHIHKHSAYNGLKRTKHGLNAYHFQTDALILNDASKIHVHVKNTHTYVTWREWMDGELSYGMLVTKRKEKRCRWLFIHFAYRNTRKSMSCSKQDTYWFILLKCIQIISHTLIKRNSLYI